ncbi:hypothetical protein BGZ60DRAFT_515213 [Tricladium varicosporioides]|nr:hypothetical protein BGZ60DRAFT_515213 [Hymenoscyphus varicosporioides]
MSFQREITRNACDNCHSRKLKCERSEETNTCYRCFQGNIICNYSPWGSSRLRKRQKNFSSARSIERSAKLTGNFGNAQEKTPDQSVEEWGSNDCETGTSDTREWIQLGNNWKAMAAIERVGSDEIYEEHHLSAHTSPTVDFQRPDPFLFLDYQSASGIDTSTGNILPSLSTSSDTSSLFPGANFSTRTSNSGMDWRGPKPSVSHALQTISDLVAEIQTHSQMIAELELEQTKGDVLPKFNVQCSPPNFATEICEHKTAPIFPVDETLRISYMLMQAISGLLDVCFPESDSTSQSLNPSNVPGKANLASSRKLDDAAILLILSCYLSLLKVYDTLFTKAAEAFKANSPKSLSLPTTTSQIGQFQIPAAISYRHALRIALETAADTQTQLRSNVERLRAAVATQRGSTSLTCMAETILELVQGHERALAENIKGTIVANRDQDTFV